MVLSKEETNKRRREQYALLSEEEKEKRRAWAREYAKIHRKDLSEYGKRYRKENPDTYRESKRRRRQTLKQTNPEYLIWMENKKRARQRGIPFDLDISDVILPKVCPILGIELSFGSGTVHDASPSLDRVIPSKGYVKGNCFVISAKANRMKQENTLEDFEKIINYIKERS